MELLPVSKQVATWRAQATDDRPRVRTGWPSFDQLLRRGGLAPGTLVILAGRTRTRKTTAALNITANLLREGVHVGFVGLDESPASYVAKLMSVVARRPSEWLEECLVANRYDSDVQEAIDGYEALARRLSLARGYRPTTKELSEWQEAAEFVVQEPMRVVVIDYVSLLTRDRYAGPEVQRVQRLIEDLQVWTNERQLVTIALHQVGRFDEGTGGRYHGDVPLTLEGLKWGGEEVADLVWATYRPALDPVGHMSWPQAQAWNPKMAQEEWEMARDSVRRFEKTTFIQLLKNRPGTHTCEEGIPLISPDESMFMREAEPGEVEETKVGEDMRLPSSYLAQMAYLGGLFNFLGKVRDASGEAVKEGSDGSR